MLTWHGMHRHLHYQVYNAAAMAMQFKKTEVLIDNQANVSIVQLDLLRDIKPAEEQVKINGIGGHQFMVDHTGFLDPLFRVYTSEDTQANILSLAEVEDKFLVTYVPQENFLIHLPRVDIVFHHKNGMFVADKVRTCMQRAR